MKQAFICDALRTPFGRYGGSLSTVRPDDLAGVVLRELLARNPHLDPSAIGDVILGCANQAGEDNRNVARSHWGTRWARAAHGSSRPR
jgi:acetyl-CoA acetyltransferase